MERPVASSRCNRSGRQPPPPAPLPEYFFDCPGGLLYDGRMSAEEHAQYKTTVTDEHWREEEYQWVRILTSPNPARAMVLLYIQKACTAFHEFEPAWRAGALKGERLEFFRRRLAKRIEQVLTTMENNGLGKINGATQLAEILRCVRSAESADELAGLSERVHSVSHLLLDSLEGE